MAVTITITNTIPVLRELRSVTHFTHVIHKETDRKMKGTARQNNRNEAGKNIIK
jgi:hypothetical protein